MNKNSNYISLIKFKMIKKLINSGFSKDQSENLIKTIAKLIPDTKNIATKSDIQKIINEIGSIKQEIEKLELRMIIKLGSIIAVSCSLLASLHKIF